MCGTLTITLHLPHTASAISHLFFIPYLCACLPSLLPFVFPPPSFQHFTPYARHYSICLYLFVGPLSFYQTFLSSLPSKPGSTLPWEATSITEQSNHTMIHTSNTTPSLFLTVSHFTPRPAFTSSVLPSFHTWSLHFTPHHSNPCFLAVFKTFSLDAYCFLSSRLCMWNKRGMERNWCRCFFFYE